MHEYILPNHDRKQIYYFTAILSGIIGVGITYLLKTLYGSTGVLISAPSGLGVFILIFALFDNFLWKISGFYKLGLIRIPNLDGEWVAEIYYKEDKPPVSASLTIHQTYTKMRIRLETDKSQSLSQMAIIEMLDPKCFKLRYQYNAEFHKDFSTTLTHRGVGELTLNSEDHNFNKNYEARYYTDIDRDTHGKIIIKRKECEA